MKYKIYIIGILFLLVLPLMVAEGEELWFEPGEIIDLKLYCFDINNTFCNSTTTCQITGFYPNSTSRLFYNESMTYANNYFNYSVNTSSTLGAYSTIAYCQSGDSKGYKSIDFYVGRPSTAVQEGTTTRAIYVLFGISFLFFLAFLKLEKDIWKYSFFLFSIFFFVMAINIVSISLYNEAGNENIRNIFDTLGGVTYYMYWFIAGLFLFLWVFTTISTLADRKHMKQAEAVGSPTNFT